MFNVLGGAAKHWVSLAFCFVFLNKHTHHTQASSGFECRLCRSEPTAPGQALGVWEGWLPDTLVCPEWGLAAGEPQGESCWKTHLKERKKERNRFRNNVIKWNIYKVKVFTFFFLGNIQKYTCGNSQLHSSHGCWGVKPGGRRRRETRFFWRACRRTKVCHQPADQHRESVYKPGDKLRPTHSESLLVVFLLCHTTFMHSQSCGVWTLSSDYSDASLPAQIKRIELHDVRASTYLAGLSDTEPTTWREFPTGPSKRRTAT